MAALTLPPEHVAAINAALRTLHDVVPLIVKAERCGVDCSKHREQVEQLTDQLTKFKQEFGKAPQ